MEHEPNARTNVAAIRILQNFIFGYNYSFLLIELILRVSQILAAVHTVMSANNSTVTSTWHDSRMLHRVNNTDTDTMVIMAARCLMPTASSLWWMWFLSGRNGFFQLRIRCK